MLVKNLMEQKQLDFNQPLLSVRRFSSTASTKEAKIKRKTDDALSRIPPPVYKSELKSGPLRNPGTVPFVWERSPGRPKDEIKPPNRALQRPPVAPKLPPGRILNDQQQASVKGSEGAKQADRSQTRNGHSSFQNETKEKISKEATKDASSSGSESGEEAYADALDILSRSESFFLNCSISGVSGLDGPDLKPSEAFFTDQHGQDFMMARFLPAAKAMASETPQCFTRKQPVVRELPRQIAKATSVERHPLNRYSPNNIPNYAQADAVEDSEDEDHDDDRPDDPSLKLCGLLPQLCSQNSLCFMNPVLGMRKQVQVPISSVCTTKSGSSNAASRNFTAHEHQRNAMYEKRESIRIACKTENKRLDESSACKGWHGKVASPTDSQFPQPVHEEQRCTGIPDKCRNSGATDFIQCAKGGTIFRELLADESREWESVSAVSVAEKTLYIDSMHMVKPQNSNSSSSDARGLSECSKDDVEILVKNREIEETDDVDSSLLDSKHLSTVGEKKKLRPDSLESVDSCFLSLSDKSIDDVHMAVMDGSRQDKDSMQVSNTMTSPKVDKDGKINLENRSDKKLGNLESSHVFIQDSNGEVAGNGRIDLESQKRTKLSNKESSIGCYTQLLLPPPLPKSPSESWLKRTLPIISSRNSSSRSPLGMHLHSRVQASKTFSGDPKWETIVRTANIQHGHLRFSEDLLTPIPET
ncbi:hypothetical protein NC653_033463 [Populus alba x Populus x berolinensis]|uniref:Uncharacterized protein n=1 Tax=Populus alba x Populus x berolinensis TaxID=444605 RepID=A0AAD6LTQ1_9ROSI|nr:hypothetical protein NC653_033463 [Populus alba x Populus x berolinensis]